MFHTFVSAPAVRFGVARFAVASFSVATHAGLIAFAAVSSGRTSATLETDERIIPAEHLEFVRMPTRADPAEAARGLPARAPKNTVRLVVPDMTKLKAVADASFANLPEVPETPIEIDLTSHVTDSRDFADADTHSLVDKSSMWVLAHPGANGAYAEDVVERTAWPMRDNPRPRYPTDLQRAGIEGSLVVQFVVDSTGRVDAKTLAFPTNAQPMFLRAIKEALLRSRYFPAELAGMRVRQLVQQQFTFVIAR